MVRFKMEKQLEPSKASVVSTFEYPNKKTLKAFAEDKSSMSAFNSIDELRKDLLISFYSIFQP
ncbi:MAG: hypothetical protein HQK68_07190 [Desulfamplus sp.]|nr:hypothetical protein [Desulfamplus sp.]